MISEAYILTMIKITIDMLFSFVIIDQINYSDVFQSTTCFI